MCLRFFFLRIQLADGLDQFFLVLLDFFQKSHIRQGLVSPQGLGQLRSGPLELVKAQVLGHALQGMGRQESTLPVLGRHGGFQIAEGGVGQVLAHKFPQHLLAGIRFKTSPALPPTCL